MTAAMHGSSLACAEPRWLVRRKAEAAAAMVRADAAPAEQACLRYGVSFAQFEACQRPERNAAPIKAHPGLFQLRWPLSR